MGVKNIFDNMHTVKTTNRTFTKVSSVIFRTNEVKGIEAQIIFFDAAGYITFEVVPIHELLTIS